MSLDEDAVRIHMDSLVVDTHCDTLKCLSPSFTGTLNSMWVDRSRGGLGIRGESGHVDIPRLREGGVDCQVFAISSIRDRTPPFALRTAMETLDIFHAECDKNRDAIVPVVTYDDIIRANRAGRVAALLSIEGADVIEGSIGTLRMLYRLGVRMVGLVHSLRNLLADGVEDSRTKGGLSELGVQVVQELFRLGVVIDVSHLSDSGFWDLIDLVKGPIVASHSNCRALCNHPRNLTDDQIRALAERGGVIGMNFAPFFIVPDEKLRTGRITNVEDLVEHVDHILDLDGSNHIGLGSDFDGIPSTPVGLEDVSKMPNITKALVRRGYSEKDIKRILGENHLRVFKKVIG